jgi:type II secretory pathway pseudopilin PulG
MRYRYGWSLLEVVVVIGILALLTGLVITAVQRVRLAAVKAASENNLRHIILGTHQLADTRQGQIKGLTQANLPFKPFYLESTIFYEILPWIYGERQLPDNPTPDQIGEYICPTVKAYLSPGDISLHHSGFPGLDKTPGKCSYSANMLAFDGSTLIPFSIPDGMSSTIAFSERYFYCASTQEFAGYDRIYPARPDGSNGGNRRATLADKGWHDVLPVQDFTSGKTVASIRGKTFQVRPTVEDADSKIPQTPFLAGLPVALFDGSVRTLSPSIDESIFWSLVTPNGGEVIGDF